MGTVLDSDEQALTYLGRMAPARSTIKTAPISVNAGAVHEIIAAPGAGKRIVITGYWYVAAANVYVDLRDGTEELVDDLLAQANQVYSDRGCVASPVFVLSENAAFNFQTQIAVYTTGYVTYYIEDV